MTVLATRLTEADAPRPNIHRALAEADMSSDNLRKFAVFALGWFGNKSPEEAVICLERWQRMQSEAVCREPANHSEHI